MLSKTPVHLYAGSNVTLGTAAGKLFRVGYALLPPTPAPVCILSLTSPRSRTVSCRSSPLETPTSSRSPTSKRWWSLAEVGRERDEEATYKGAGAWERGIDDSPLAF